MDELRGIRKSDSLSRLLDGHAVHTNPFGRNSSGEKAYHRAERLVAALHLITAHVRENEPIRESIRVAGIRLLSNILALRDELRSSGSHRIHTAQATIRELISLTRMLAVSGLISWQNAEIIVEAIDSLGDFLAVSQRTPFSESTLLSQEGLLSGGATADKRTRTVVKDRPAQAAIQTDRGISDATDSVTDKTSQPSRTAGSTSSRGREILGVLRSGGELGIRDISSNLPEYSEKMIQRELASMVAAGKVKKTGLKRWSRYSIVVGNV